MAIGGIKQLRQNRAIAQRYNWRTHIQPQIGNYPLPTTQTTELRCDQTAWQPLKQILQHSKRQHLSELINSNLNPERSLNPIQARINNSSK